MPDAEPTILTSPPADDSVDVPVDDLVEPEPKIYSQREFDSAAASIRRGAEKKIAAKYQARIVALEAELAARPQLPKLSIEEWQQALAALASQGVTPNG